MPAMRAFCATLMAAWFLASVGCGSSKATRSENDRLRVQVMELQTQVQSLEQRNQELQSQLRIATGTASADNASDEPAPDGGQGEGEGNVASPAQGAAYEVAAATPRLADISIGRLSFVRDSDADGRPDQIIIYLHPVDGRGRFLQLVGSLSATATFIPVTGDPATLGRVELSPLQVRDAYRAGLTGTHYTIELPIEASGNMQQQQQQQLPQTTASAAPPPTTSPSQSAHDAAFVRVIFADAQTGQTFTAERSIPFSGT